MTNSWQYQHLKAIFEKGCNSVHLNHVALSGLHRFLIVLMHHMDIYLF